MVRNPRPRVSTVEVRRSKSEGQFFEMIIILLIQISGKLKFQKIIKKLYNI